MVTWPPDAKSQLTGKDPDAGKECRQKEKGVAEDEMARQNHSLNGHESEQTPANRGGQGKLGPLVQRVGHDLVIEQQHTGRFYCHFA